MTTAHVVAGTLYFGGLTVALAVMLAVGTGMLP